MKCECRTEKRDGALNVGFIEYRIEKCPLCKAAPDLYEACKLQHDALDRAMAMLIDLTRKDGIGVEPFMPSQSPMWPAIVAGNAAIQKAGAE